MPVFNREQTLRQAMESVLAQSLDDLELLVIDDGSTDGSLELARSFRDKRVRVECNPKNLGQTPTRNRGIEFVRGRYVAMLDSDDYARPERLARQVSFLEAHPQHAEVGSWVMIQDDRSGRNRIKRHPTQSREIKAWLPWRNTISHTSVMIRSEILKRVRYNEHFVQCQDYDLHIRLSREFELGNIPEVLTVKRVHDDQVTRRFDLQDNFKMQAIKSLLEDLGVRPDPVALEHHYRLTRTASGVAGPDLAWARDWLQALLAANVERQRLPEPELSAVAAQVWGQLCWKRRTRNPLRLVQELWSGQLVRHYPRALVAATLRAIPF
jgi:glycosyltransferase involved in cell wall biosynthesis